MPEINYSEVQAYLVGVAKEAGKIILDARPSAKIYSIKKNGADIVTESDQAVEGFVFGRLQNEYPDFSLVGEESHKVDILITNAPTFIVDPIDGTSNFVHGFPAVCISIGLVIDRKPVVGVVYNPFHDELWYAAQGSGAFTQKSGGQSLKLPLVPRPLEGLETACIGIEWGSDREGPNFELNLKVFMTLARTRRTGGKMTNSLRCTGSAAITISRVAAGQQDIFWECGCWVWDVAAAWCILSEAGGLMVDGHPGLWDPPIDNRRYLAVRPALTGQREIVKDFWAVIGHDRSTYGPPGQGQPAV
ncbi:hypothetical protein ACHAQA_009716 [Verticillium albo-atrum]